MNSFKTLDQSRRDYRAYVESFQRFRNPQIREFVRKGMDEGDLLWREPLIQISRQFKPGESLGQLAKDGKPHKKCRDVFRARARSYRGGTDRGSNGSGCTSPATL